MDVKKKKSPEHKLGEIHMILAAYVKKLGFLIGYESNLIGLSKKDHVLLVFTVRSKVSTSNKF